MSASIDSREIAPGLYEIFQGDKILDTAEGVTELQSRLGTLKSRMAYEAIIKERDTLREQVKLLNEQIAILKEVKAGHEWHLAETLKTLRKMDDPNGR